MFVRNRWSHRFRRCKQITINRVYYLDLVDMYFLISTFINIFGLGTLRKEKYITVSIETNIDTSKTIIQGFFSKDLSFFLHKI